MINKNKVKHRKRFVYKFIIENVTVTVASFVGTVCLKIRSSRLAFRLKEAA